MHHRHAISKITPPPITFEPPTKHYSPTNPASPLQQANQYSPKERKLNSPKLLPRIHVTAAHASNQLLFAYTFSSRIYSTTQELCFFPASRAHPEHAVHANFKHRIVDGTTKATGTQRSNNHRQRTHRYSTADQRVLRIAEKHEIEQFHGQEMTAVLPDREPLSGFPRILQL